MSAFLNQVAASDHRLLWIDDSEYSAKLLAADAAPWLDTSAYVAWRRKAQSLLNSSVAALPVARVCDALLAKDGRMRAAMGAKSRAGYPLKTLLSSEALRRQVAELLVGLRSSFPALSLALVCPSPRSWVTEAHRLAFGNGTTVIVGEEEVDSATMHCADFLREFAGTGIDTVLLEESPESEPQGASELEWYRSVLNVGAHYRWDMGLRMPGPGHLGGAIADIAYLISTRVESGVCCGELIPAQFWSGAPFEGSPWAAFRFVQIPPHIQPEVVLDRLASLR